MPHGVIREVGEYEITIDLNYDVLAQVKLKVQGTATAGAATANTAEADQDA